LFEVLDKVKWDRDILTKGLREKFLINECGYKAFPTEALTHQPITAAIEVMQENNLDTREVKEVLVETTTRGADILSDPSKYKPTTKETADHSLPYCIAVAIAKGNVLPSDFEEDALRDPLVWSLLDKIKVVANSEIDALFPKVKRAIVTIKTSQGEYKKQEDFAKGQPERPLSEEELISKFKANSEKKISSSRMEDIIKATKGLENIDETGEYMELLASDK
jgi:2-methylcitrate dehydratase